jgi:hypothetical protein
LGAPPRARCAGCSAYVGWRLRHDELVGDSPAGSGRDGRARGPREYRRRGIDHDTGRVVPARGADRLADRRRADDRAAGSVAHRANAGRPRARDGARDARRALVPRRDRPPHERRAALEEAAARVLAGGGIVPGVRRQRVRRAVAVRARVVAHGSRRVPNGLAAVGARRGVLRGRRAAGECWGPRCSPATVGWRRPTRW